jgi:hypothetical protein
MDTVEEIRKEADKAQRDLQQVTQRARNTSNRESEDYLLLAFYLIALSIRELTATIAEAEDLYIEETPKENKRNEQKK